MDKQISVIVTHYNESWEICKPLLDSIEVQIDYDLQKLEVIWVNDSDELMNLPKENYHFDITEYAPGHKGVSAARNFGLSKSNGEYVIFCDCDDCFCSMFSLNVYDKAIRENPIYDLIRGSFIEDQLIDGEWKLIRHDYDVVFIHAKLWKKEFLLENDLKFNEELTIHEDGYFNTIACSLATSSTRETQVATYLWRTRPDSVVRKDSEAFVYKTYNHLMKCRAAICKEFERRGMIQELHHTVAKTVLDSYYDFQNTEALIPEYADIMKRAKKQFKKFYMEWKNIYKEMGIPDLASMMCLCREGAVNRGMKIEQQSLREFLNEIVKL